MVVNTLYPLHLNKFSLLLFLACKNIINSLRHKRATMIARNVTVLPTKDTKGDISSDSTKIGNLYVAASRVNFVISSLNPIVFLFQIKELNITLF